MYEGPNNTNVYRVTDNYTIHLSLQWSLIKLNDRPHSDPDIILNNLVSSTDHKHSSLTEYVMVNHMIKHLRYFIALYFSDHLVFEI